MLLVFWTPFIFCYTTYRLTLSRYNFEMGARKNKSCTILNRECESGVLAPKNTPVEKFWVRSVSPKKYFFSNFRSTTEKKVSKRSILMPSTFHTARLKRHSSFQGVLLTLTLVWRPGPSKIRKSGIVQ